MEVRKKLTQMQVKVITEVAEKVTRAQTVLQDQQEKAQLTQALIFEAHDIPQGAKVNFDPETQELVFEVPDAPAKPAKTAR